MRLGKRPLGVGIGIGVLAIGVFIYVRYGRSPAPPRFETAAASRGAVVAKVTSSGTLSALVTVQVGSQVSGRLQSIWVDFNSPVKKGQLIAKIDPRLFEAAVEQSRANLVAAQGNLTKAEAQAKDAERQYRRLASLLTDKLVAQADVDTAEANFNVATAQVASARGGLAQARAALHQTQVNLDYTNIISPINGVVISRNVDVGQTVAASLQAPILFTIAEDLSKMQVDASIAEADIGKLAPGMKAIFNVDAYVGERFEGVIRQIRNAAATVQNVVTYDAVIDVANPELKLKPGMSANVTIVYAEKDDVLRVPNAALRFRPPPEQPLFAAAAKTAPDLPDRGARKLSMAQAGAARSRTIWRLRPDNQPEPVLVQLGLSDGSLTEAESDKLQDGDRLITDVFIDAPAKNAGATPFGGAAPSGGRRNPF